MQDEICKLIDALAPLLMEYKDEMPAELKERLDSLHNIIVMLAVSQEDD